MFDISNYCHSTLPELCCHSGPQHFKGPCSVTLYSSHFPSASQNKNKLDLPHISASISSYYFLNTAGAVFFHICSPWDTAALSEIRTLVMTQHVKITL